MKKDTGASSNGVAGGATGVTPTPMVGGANTGLCVMQPAVHSATQANASPRLRAPTAAMRRM
jgi:hypothetical protein